MSQIGSLSGASTSILFEASGDAVRTIQGPSWSTSAGYAAMARHGDSPLTEFTGPEGDKFSFSMVFRQDLGVEPMTEIAKLLAAQRSGEVLRLVLGSHAYGLYRWTIQSCKFKLERFDRDGNVTEASASVSLLAYAQR